MPFVQCGWYDSTGAPLGPRGGAPECRKRSIAAQKDLDSRRGFHQTTRPMSPPRKPRNAPRSPKAMRSTGDSSGFDSSSWGLPSSSTSIPQSTATLRNFTGGWGDSTSSNDPVVDSGSNGWGSGSGGGWGSPKATTSGWGSSAGWGTTTPSWDSSNNSGWGSWGSSSKSSDKKETSTSSWGRSYDASPTRRPDTAKEPERPQSRTQQTHAPVSSSSSLSDMKPQPSYSRRLDKIDTNLSADVRLSRRDSRPSPTTSIPSSVDRKTADPLRPMRPLPQRVSSRQSSVSRSESTSRRLIPDSSLTSQLDQAEVSKLLNGPTTELTTTIIKLMIEAVHLKLQLDKAQYAYDELHRTLTSPQYHHVNNAGRDKFTKILQDYSDSLSRQKKLLAGTLRNLSRLPDLAKLDDADSAIDESALLTYAGELEGWMEQTKTYALALKNNMAAQTREIQGPTPPTMVDLPPDQEVGSLTTPATELLRSADAAENKVEDLLTGFYSMNIESLAVTKHLDTMISSKIADDTRGARLQDVMVAAAQMEAEFNKVTDIAADLFTKQGAQKVQLRMLEGNVSSVQKKRLKNTERAINVEQTNVDHAQLLGELMDKLRNLHTMEETGASKPQLPLTNEQMEECVDIIVDRFMEDLRPTLDDTQTNHLRQIQESTGSITNTLWPRLEPFALAVRSLAIKVSPLNNPQESIAAE